MKKFFAFLLLLASTLVLANPIDDNCPHLTFGVAPAVQASQFVCHTQYAVAYSYKTHNPIYTTEFLDKSHTGSLPRTDDFKIDPAIPKQYQAKPSDYDKAVCGPGTDRCDRGHMTPAQDFSSCDKCVHESFYMSNMVPQNYKNNEVVWKGLEGKIRAYATSRPKGVYVVTGPAYKNPQQPSSTIGKTKVWVPDSLFKIVIDAATGASAAYLMPNAPQDDLTKFVSQLSTIEALTGIQFDKQLDKTATKPLF